MVSIRFVPLVPYPWRADPAGRTVRLNARYMIGPGISSTSPNDAFDQRAELAGLRSSPAKTDDHPRWRAPKVVNADLLPTAREPLTSS